STLFPYTTLFRSKIAARHILQVIPDHPHNVERINLDQIFTRSQPGHILRIPRRSRAADTNLPVGVLHSRNDAAAMEHPIGLYPERRPPLLHGELVALGE